jgi:hypothetical protein
MDGVEAGAADAMLRTEKGIGNGNEARVKLEDFRCADG